MPLEYEHLGGGDGGLVVDCWACRYRLNVVTADKDNPDDKRHLLVQLRNEMYSTFGLEKDSVIAQRARSFFDERIRPLLRDPMAASFAEQDILDHIVKCNPLVPLAKEVMRQRKLEALESSLFECAQFVKPGETIKRLAIPAVGKIASVVNNIRKCDLALAAHRTRFQNGEGDQDSLA